MAANAAWLPDVLSDAYRGVAGAQFEVYPGYKNRGGKTLYPRGQINHHTGRGSYNALLSYMAEGSTISPLCNVATSRPQNGVVRITVVTIWRANHAGRGYLPWTGQNMGNAYSIGWEHMNDGSQPWPDQQNEMIAIGNIAVAKHLGTDFSRIADHDTYAPTRKVDRHTITAESWRNYLETFQGVTDMSISKGATGPFVERIQKDVNVLLTYHHLGPEKMSVNPRDGVGIAVDGDYGPATAAGIAKVMADLAGINVSGDTFGAVESYIFLRHGYYADDLRHRAIGNHGSGGMIDTSGFATKSEFAAVDGKLAKLNTHKHAEGTTGPPVF